MSIHSFIAIALYVCVLQTIVDDGEEAVDSRSVAGWDKGCTSRGPCLTPRALCNKHTGRETH